MGLNHQPYHTTPAYYLLLPQVQPQQLQLQVLLPLHLGNMILISWRNKNAVGTINWDSYMEAIKPDKMKN